MRADFPFPRLIRLDSDLVDRHAADSVSSLVESIYDSLNKTQHILAEKGFDKVNHEIVLRKLYLYVV